MSRRSVLCIAAHPTQADRILNRLKAAKFSCGDISVLSWERAESYDDFKITNVIEFRPGKKDLARTGSVDGDEQPFGGPPESPAPADMPNLEPSRCLEMLLQGSILMCVHVRNAWEIARANDIFTSSGGQEISTIV